jgi:cytochrome c biogenesis protein CcdA
MLEDALQEEQLANCGRHEIRVPVRKFEQADLFFVQQPGPNLPEILLDDFLFGVTFCAGGLPCPASMFLEQDEERLE